MLGRDLGDREGLERGELGQGFVPLGDPILELGDLGLEPFDLPSPGVDDLASLLQNRKAPFEPLGKVLVGAWPGVAVPVLLRVEAGQGDAGFGGQGLQVALAAGREFPAQQPSHGRLDGVLVARGRCR
ncbi:hypothetical protein [Streptomyces bullii]|uniref:Uncharacterized protein n=1 Tax=Streptomyces bullii TaxID=349910 RepID=A0ABW0UN51_9ACTN